MGNSIGWPQTADKAKAEADFRGALLSVLTDIALYEAKTYVLVKHGPGNYEIIEGSTPPDGVQLLYTAHGNGNIEPAEDV